jgi:feruloyl esterase
LIITPKSTTSYYDAVTTIDSNAHDFYRLFLAPGLSHCFGGNGAYPDGTFDAMRKWVEEGVAPEALNASSVGENVIERILCPYPKKQDYGGNSTGDVSGGEGFYCK